jgi:seryl-tRNA synthetase
MLDIKFIRENKELVEQAAKKKRIEFDVDKLLGVDDNRKVLLGKVEEKRAEQKVFNNEIVKASSEERDKILEKMKVLKGTLEKEEEELRDERVANSHARCAQYTRFVRASWCW